MNSTKAKIKTLESKEEIIRKEIQSLISHNKELRSQLNEARVEKKSLTNRLKKEIKINDSKYILFKSDQSKN
jgi:hypothetical protein